MKSIFTKKDRSSTYATKNTDLIARVVKKGKTPIDGDFYGIAPSFAASSSSPPPPASPPPPPPPAPQTKGGAKKQYVMYNNRRYIVKKEGKKNYITSKGNMLFLSEIKGKYKKCA